MTGGLPAPPPADIDLELLRLAISGRAGRAVHLVTDYTMEMRLCDDNGMVSSETAISQSGLLVNLTYLQMHNNMASHRDPRRSLTTKPFACTGSAHYGGGEHIRCTSPAHNAAAITAHYSATGSPHGFCVHGGELPGDCDRASEPDRRPSYVYVASSWRCAAQPLVINVLKSAGIPHYDFRNPEGGTGFGWREVMPTFDIDEEKANVGEYLRALDHPRSVAGFDSDFAAMKRADAFVLVLPCGRSAHLELGWAVGAGKRTAILLDPDRDRAVTPELMYKMVDLITPSISDLLGWMGIG